MNKFLKSISLKADALDMYGDPAACADREVKDLKYLPTELAQVYYNQIKDLFDNLETDVKRYKKQEKINELEKQLKDLKNE